MIAATSNNDFKRVDQRSALQPENATSRRGVTITAHPVAASQLPKEESSHDNKPIRERQINSDWATLASASTGIAGALFFVPATGFFGAFALGCAGALYGGLAGGGEVLFASTVTGMAVGAVGGLVAGAIPVLYLSAKVYNRVLEATNDDGVRRS